MFSSLCLFYSIIIIVIVDSVFADPDLTVVVEVTKTDTYNFKCIIGENALETPIYWTKENGEPLVTSNFNSSYISNDVEFKFAENENNEKWNDTNEWKIKNSSKQLLQPILDERWEEFQTKKVTESKELLWSGKKFVSVSASVFVNSTEADSSFDYRIDIGNKYMKITYGSTSVHEQGTFKLLSQKEFKNKDDSWKHFVIAKDKEVMKMRVTFFPNLEQITWNISKSDNFTSINITQGPIRRALDKKNGFYKLHKYNILFSKKKNENSHQIGPTISYKGKLCITMFIAVCNSCSLDIYIQIDEKISHSVTMEAEKINKSEHLYLWQRFNITANIEVEKNINIFVQKKYNGSNEGFWAIRSIRFCKSTDVRIASVNEIKSTDINEINDIKCQSLENAKFRVPAEEINLPNLTCSTGQLGESCNIECKDVFKQSEDYCGNTICTSRGCSCSWGFQGKMCKEACNSSWGENCRKKCGKCKGGKNCNPYNGSCEDGCEKTYTGNQCTGSLPFLKNAPTVVNISHTKIEIKINTTYSESTESTYFPTEIQIQYRKINEDTWKNSSLFKYESSPQFVIKDIKNLEPATRYDIRAVLITNERSVDENSKILKNVRTTCEEITEDTIDIKPEKYSAILTFKPKDSTTCKLEIYTVNMTSLSSNNNRSLDIDSENSNNIMGLPAYTEFKIIFYNNYTNVSITKMFKTKPTNPGVVSNITWDSYYNNSVFLSWQPPEKSGKDLSYSLEYKLSGYIACNSNITQKTNEIKVNGIKKEEIELRNLNAYSYYTINITAINEAGAGKTLEITVATKTSEDLLNDELPTNVRFKDEQIHITTPSCEKIKGPLNYYIEYIYDDEQSCIDDPVVMNIEDSVQYSSDTIKQNVPKLRPYTKYSVKIWAKRDTTTKLEFENILNYKSKPSEPPAVKNLMAYSKNESQVWLRWIAPCPPYGKLENYIIAVTNIKTNKNITTEVDVTKTTCLWENEECFTIKGLSGHESYQFVVAAKNEDVVGYGRTANISLTTKEEESQSPKNVSGILKEGMLSLNWIHPDVTNGPIQNFQIDGYIIESGLENTQNISEVLMVEMDQLHYNKKINVTPATTFNITIVAMNSKRGKPASILIITPPPKPELSSTPFINFCSEGTCSINIPPAKLCVNCSTYLVVTTEANGRTNSPLQKFSFYNKLLDDEENSKILQSQQWITPISSNMTLQNISIDGSDREKMLYNTSNYLMHIIIVSSYNEQYATKTYHLDYGLESTRVNNLYFLLLLLVIPLAVLSILIYRFWRKNKEGKETTNDNSPIKDNAEPNIPDDTYPLMVLPPIGPKPNGLKEPKHKYSKVIQLNDLKSYLIEAVKGDTNNSELSKQHELCKGGYTKSIEVGSMEINRKKNRYKDLIAYDHTRVKLKYTDENGSDYINANYIDSYSTKRAYIATQGPKVSTVNDFWYMIWEQNVGNIVMLANVVENGKKKCEEYWPAINQLKICEDITVENKKTKVFSSYIHRELQVTYNGKKRMVNHLHFTLWPDHGVPLYPQNLVPFMKEMLKIPQGKCPIVVHCSAGIGRTGTIILCDIALRMAALENKVDFLKIYHQLREQRPKMVDNSAQYILAHLVVYECLFGKDFSVSTDVNFKNKMQTLLTDVSIKSMMDYLEEVSWQIKIMQEYFHNELLEMNKRKNRFHSILPGCSQVYLERYPPDDESSDYINAINMDCFQYPDRFIVTQQPLPNTVGDFWRLILQYEVNIIISLNEIQQSDQTSCIFWPRKNESFYPVDYIKVSYESEEDRGDFDLIKIALTDENENQKRIITLICLNRWMPEMAVPASVSGVLAVKDYMFNATFGYDNPIVVTCYDGARACGLYVALSFLIEKIKLEHSCDVVLAVSSVRQKRMQCFRDKEQFKFLLKVALAYVESFETYSNFENL